MFYLLVWSIDRSTCWSWTSAFYYIWYCSQRKKFIFIFITCLFPGVKYQRLDCDIKFHKEKSFAIWIRYSYYNNNNNMRVINIICSWLRLRTWILCQFYYFCEIACSKIICISYGLEYREINCFYGGRGEALHKRKTSWQWTTKCITWMIFWFFFLSELNALSTFHQDKVIYIF